MGWLVGLAVLLGAVGCALLVWGRWLRRASGVPEGTILYDDSGAHEEIERPLVSHRYGLVGRPDYLLRRREHGREVIIPVEVKSRRSPAQAHPGHVLQVGAYCLLVEELYGQTPAYGLLRYADGVTPVAFTASLRREVLEATEGIRRARHAVDVPRSHDDPQRCRRCGYRDACGQAVE